jgi:hypothetical protein
MLPAETLKPPMWLVRPHLAEIQEKDARSITERALGMAAPPQGPGQGETAKT